MNCKPGDLAIITNTFPHHRDAIGRIVNVVGTCPIDGCSWAITFVGDPPESAKPATYFYILDNKLRPVSGLPDNEDIDIEQPIKDVV